MARSTPAGPSNNHHLYVRNSSKEKYRSWHRSSRLLNKSGVTRTKRTGTVLRELAVATFDPSGNTAQRPIGAYGLGVYLPTKAIITNVIIDIVTTFTSATDAATIAISAQSANDIVAALAISDASNSGTRDFAVPRSAIRTSARMPRTTARLKSQRSSQHRW